MGGLQVEVVEREIDDTKSHSSLLICSACGGPMNYHFYDFASLAYCQNAKESVLNHVDQSLIDSTVDSWVLIKCTDELD